MHWLLFLKDRGLATSVGDEGGGFAPALNSYVLLLMRRAAWWRALPTMPRLTCLNTALRRGTSGNPEDARAMVAPLAATLKEYGFNLDFAPVADVNTNPDNPVIGTRAFSSEPQTAADLGAGRAPVCRCGHCLYLKHFMAIPARIPTLVP